MRIIDGKDAVLGRLASYAAKESLKGDEVIIVNCEEIIISGNVPNIRREYLEKKGKVGSVQKGPKHSKLVEKLVKRTIRGMLPNHRWGRGRDAYKRIKCFIGIPKEFEKLKIEKMASRKLNKFMYIREIWKS
ncbi:MAG: 50S ribosomal protein L13 [archaeon]|nr:50S ribosomal protein L13 [archaeon]